MRPALAALVVLAGVSHAAVAQEAPRAMGALGRLDVVGARWVFSRLGLPADIERASVPRILFHRWFDPDVSLRLADAALADVREHQRAAIEAEDAARRVEARGVLSLASIRTRQSRRALVDALEAIGLDLVEARGRWSVTVVEGERANRRRSMLADLGFDAGAAATRLNGGDTIRVALPAEALPLPFSPAFWSTAILDAPVAERALFARLLDDRRAFLLWIGALALDRPTREYLESHPDLLQSMGDESAAVFATFGATISVTRQGLDVQGGAEARALWEVLVGEKASDPARFLKRLLSENGGRLAVFYDLIQRLPEPNRRFALGLWMADRERRAERFRALYEAVSGTDPSWKPFLAPARRFPDDPWLLLRGLRFVSGGPGSRLLGPEPRRFWHAALSDSIPDDPARELREIDRDGPVDAAWLVERVCRDARDLEERHLRFLQVLGTQRIASAWPPDATPDLLVAASALPRFTTLILALERSALLAPPVSTMLVRRAQALADMGDADERLLASAAFQGAIALLCRLVGTGNLDRAAALNLLGHLASPTLQERGRDAAVAAWLVGEVVPALGAGPATDERLVRALAVTTDTRAEVDWEGERYIVDWSQAERERLAAIRRQQAGFQLEDVAELLRCSEAAASAQGVAAARDLMSRLRQVARRLADLPPLVELEEPARGQALVREAIDTLARVTATSDRRTFERVAAAVASAAELGAAHLLVALAYVPHLGSPDGPAARAADLAMRHRLRTNDPSPYRRHHALWEPPAEVHGGGEVTGSLLGLDLAMARLALRRLSAAVMPRPPSLSAPNLEALAAQVSLTDPRLAGGAWPGRVAGALTLGRTRAEAAMGDSGRLEALAAEAGMDLSRRRLLSWAIANEPERVLSMFALAELVALGKPDPADRDRAGTSAVAVDGEWRLAWAPQEPWEPYAGRPSTGLLASRVSDLGLRIVELMAGAALPASLYPGILALAMQDLIDGLVLVSSDDWLGAARQARALSKDRFDDYVGALVGLRILVPAEPERPR